MQAFPWFFYDNSCEGQETWQVIKLILKGSDREREEKLEFGPQPLADQHHTNLTTLCLLTFLLFAPADNRVINVMLAFAHIIDLS